MKVAIVLLVFPTFGYLINLLIGLVLIYPCYLLPETWQESAINAVKVISLVAALAGSFVICRKIWPKDEPPVSG